MQFCEMLVLLIGASKVVQMVKNLPTNVGNARDAGSFPGLGKNPGKQNENPLCILAWKIAWTEKHGRLPSKRLQRIGHD